MGWLKIGGLLHEVAEHPFILEPTANAIRPFKSEKLRFDCLSRNLAELWRLSANKVNHVKVVRDQALPGTGDLRKIEIGDSPKGAAAFHLNHDGFLAVPGGEVVAAVVGIF